MVCVGPSGEPAMDLNVAAAENKEFLSTRTSERQEMVVLNDRLAVYINKVKQPSNSPHCTSSRFEECFLLKNGSMLFSPLLALRQETYRGESSTLEITEDVFLSLQVRSLEQQNKLLEAEIEAYQNRFEKPTGLRLLYEEQLRELQKIADQMRVQRVRQNLLSNTSPVSFLTFQALNRA